MPRHRAGLFFAPSEPPRRGRGLTAVAVILPDPGAQRCRKSPRWVFWGVGCW